VIVSKGVHTSQKRKFWKKIYASISEYPVFLYFCISVSRLYFWLPMYKIPIRVEKISRHTGIQKLDKTYRI
jgi:hypothetical protein